MIKKNVKIKINVTLDEPGFEQEDYYKLASDMFDRIVNITENYGIGSLSYSLEE